jgi:SAM-dependent methyltransferase
VVHEVAQAGFSDPSDYEAARPSYPADAVAWFAEQLRLGPGTRLVDLAAGTGKLTRLLAPTQADIVAVEPVAGMRETFRAVLPTVALLAATAEALPFADASLDAISVAQAWHWFDHDRAIAEAARALQPGGALGLVWNARDRSVEWVDQIWTIMDRVEKRAPWRDHGRRRDDSLRNQPGFGPVREATFFHVQELTPEGVCRRVASVSHVAVLPDTARAAVLDDIRQLLATHPDTRGRPEVGLRYRVDCYVLPRV